MNCQRRAAAGGLSTAAIVAELRARQPLPVTRRKAVK